MNTPDKLSPNLLDRFLRLIEKTPSSDRFLLRAFFFLVLGTGIWLILTLNQENSMITPTRGGTITEGIVGTPRFVNPALALTRADQDVTALVYSGLMKIGPTGTLENDLAENITISDDGLTYHVTLRKNITFHDGTPLTAHDVIYTIQLIQDPDLKSPLRGNWTNVTLEEIGEYELNIILEEAYAPFIENFTVGIVPSHIWSNLPIEQLPFSQLNTEPIGSGPFSITSAKRDTSGLINHYTLSAYRGNDYDTKVDTIKLVFFSDEAKLLQALADHEIDASAYVPVDEIDNVLTYNYELIEEPLPRTFGIFFNQNHSTILRDIAVRKALTAALDRSLLIKTALNGHGVPITSPTAFIGPALESGDGVHDTATTTPTERAISILEAGGWIRDELGTWSKKIDDTQTSLRVTLRTSNTPLFNSLVNSIAEQWKAIGIDVVTEQFEQTGLIQSVIRPRDYEALLFGLDMSRSYDLYPFWHSSQQDDPGLNIAQYANVEVDGLLETARTEQYGPDRQTALRSASKIIADEYPAIFLFQPTFTYVIGPNMTVPNMNNLGRPADRFSNITKWHAENDSLWSIFRDDA